MESPVEEEVKITEPEFQEEPKEEPKEKGPRMSHSKRMAAGMKQ